MKKFAVVIISAITALTGVGPAHAFPAVSPPVVQQTAPAVEKVQWRGEGRRYYRGEGRRGYYRHSGRRDRHYRHYSRRDDWRRHRRYHRDRSNAGAIIGGLAAGAIIGGALAQPRYAPAPRSYAGGGSHTQWCYNRYRSYRSYDNTFQPYNGPRQQCYSPYR